MKKIIYLVVVILATVLASCAGDNSFTISDGTIGNLSKNTKVSELKTIFAKDSLVDEDGSAAFSSPAGDITVFEKGGKKLLQLSPATQETDSKIKFVQVFDERYLTDKGVGLASTFKDIQDNYSIKRIDNLIGTIVIFIEGGDVYFTIDKKQLTANLMFDTDSKIETTQIPDDATIKYFMIGW